MFLQLGLLNNKTFLMCYETFWNTNVLFTGYLYVLYVKVRSAYEFRAMGRREMVRCFVVDLGFVCRGATRLLFLFSNMQQHERAACVALFTRVVLKSESRALWRSAPLPPSPLSLSLSLSPFESRSYTHLIGSILLTITALIIIKLYSGLVLFRINASMFQKI